MQASLFQEMAKVVAKSSPTTNFLRSPLPIRKGAVHTTQSMAILPVILLSGNKKSITPPPQNAAEYPIIPYADVLVHCGDFTMRGHENEVDSFLQFMAQLPHPRKIVIAGNHEASFDETYYRREEIKKRWKFQSAPADLPRRLKKRFEREGIVYLEDSGCTSSLRKKQLSLFGSPIQPAYHDWAFQIPYGDEIHEHWKRVLPSRVDVLITHGPPLGRADRVYERDDATKTREERQRAESSTNYKRKGCPHLLWEVQHSLRPKLHVFGHIHGDAGVVEDSFDGRTLFVNAALADRHNSLRRGSVVKTICFPCEELATKR